MSPLSNTHSMQDERKKPEATVASSRGKKGPTRKSARNRAQEEDEEDEEEEVTESPKKSPEKVGVCNNVSRNQLGDSSHLV